MNQARAEPKNERMRETMKQQLLELISENNNGISVAEAMSITGLDYTGILAAVTDLCADGNKIGAIRVGKTIFRLYPVSE